MLLFYPADFTFVCPTELEEAAALYEEFKKAGAEILSVSTDTVYAHKAWHDQSPAINKIRYPMVPTLRQNCAGTLAPIWKVLVYRCAEVSLLIQMAS